MNEESSDRYEEKLMEVEIDLEAIQRSAAEIVSAAKQLRKELVELHIGL